MNSMQIVDIPLKQLVTSSANVRRGVGDITELTSSVREHGVLMPIIVRPQGIQYEVIAGSRRTAAARAAGLRSIPAVVRHLTDSEALAESLVENLQRGDLDIEEEGVAYERLLEELDSIARVAELVNKTPTHIRRMLDAVNAMRILRPAGMSIGITTRYSHEQREREDTRLLPVRHATVLEAAFRTRRVREHFSDEATRNRVYVELARAVSPLTQRHAEMVLDRFKASPDRVVSEIVNEVVTPIDVRTRVDPQLVLRLEERAQLAGLALEDVVRDAVQSYVTQLEAKAPVSGFRETRLRTERTALETHELPLKELVHGKIIWNLKRLSLEEFDHFTIGYSGRSLGQVMEILGIAHVKTLVDVRNHPYSRFRPEFSQDRLAAEATSSGMEYVHWPDMGIPQAIRSSRALADLFVWYDATVLPGKLADLDLDRCAFLCTEVDPHTCHRHRIAHYLELHSYKVLDL